MSDIFLSEQIFLGKEKEVQRKFCKQNCKFFFFWTMFAQVGDLDEVEQSLSKKCFVNLIVI